MGITSNTHNSNNAIQLDAIQGLIIPTTYWISICEVEGKRTITSTKHRFQHSSQEIHCHKLDSNTL
jgi:hypothetical protein